MKNYIITLQRFKANQKEVFQMTASGTLAEVMDQVLNFTTGFEVSRRFSRWEVIDVKDA